MTGEEQQTELDLTEEAVQADGNQEVPDPLEKKAMVVTSAEVIFQYNRNFLFVVSVHNFLNLCCFRHWWS